MRDPDQWTYIGGPIGDGATTEAAPMAHAEMLQQRGVPASVCRKDEQQGWHHFVRTGEEPVFIHVGACSAIPDHWDSPFR